MLVNQGPARPKTDFCMRRYLQFSTIKGALTAALLASQILCAVESRAQDADETSNYVEIEFPANELPPYGERRPVGQFTFGFQYEPFKPKEYTTGINGITQSYEELYGASTLKLGAVTLGYKLNLPLIGLDVSLVYGQGSVNDDRSGQGMFLLATKKGVRATVVLDGLLAENYVVPYGGVQYVTWDVSEANPTTKVSGTASYAMGMVAGAYINVNWVDKRDALGLYNEHNVNSTYVDVFMSQYQSAQTATEPNFASAMNFGAGFRVEF